MSFFVDLATNRIIYSIINRLLRDLLNQQLDLANRQTLGLVDLEHRLQVNRIHYLMVAFRPLQIHSEQIHFHLVNQQQLQAPDLDQLALVVSIYIFFLSKS